MSSGGPERAEPGTATFHHFYSRLVSGLLPGLIWFRRKMTKMINKRRRTATAWPRAQGPIQNVRLSSSLSSSPPPLILPLSSAPLLICFSNISLYFLTSLSIPPSSHLYFPLSPPSLSLHKHACNHALSLFKLITSATLYPWPRGSPTTVRPVLFLKFKQSSYVRCC